MKCICFLFGLFLLPACMFSQNTDPLGGKYNVTGFDSDKNQKYSGTVFITERNSVYTAQWTFSDQTTYDGTGVRMDKCLAFVFKQNDTNTIGVQLYHVKEDEILEGPWVRFGSASKGFEKLIKE